MKTQGKSVSDEELVEKIRREDTELYREIVGRYQQGLYRYLRHLTNRPDAAEDLVQDVLIKAYRNLFGFDTRKKFSSWIYRIAHNEGVNYIRKTGKRKSISFEDLAVPPPNENDSPEEELVREEIRRNLTECLDEMKTKYREALVLHYIEEKPYKEISDILRVPMGTVGTLIARGKNMLRAICQRKGGDLSP